MKNVVVVIFLTFTLFVTGCAGFRSTDQSSDPRNEPAYFLGDLRHTEITTIERAWHAAQAALKELNYHIKSNEHDLLEGKIVAVADEKEVKIYLRETSLTTTEIRIRVGTF